MFGSTGLFRDVACPVGTDCRLFNCIFAHPKQGGFDNTTHASESRVVDLAQETGSEPPLKKQRLSVLSTGVDKVEEPKIEASGSKARPSGKPEVLTRTNATNEASAGTPETSETPSSAQTPISPPPLQKKVTSSRKVKDLKKPVSPETSPSATPTKRPEPKSETLNPRILPKQPAPLQVRLKLTKLLHEQMDRLNNELLKSKDTYWKEKLSYSKQGVITRALDEEERAAKANPAVYANVLKLRIVALKKKTLELWKAELMAEEAKKEKSKTKSNSDAVDLTTGLSPPEEISLLAEFISPQAGLDQHGYILSPPSSEDIEKAREGIESAGGWEVCDRCATRFEVFPGRRESDGALTSGGSCTYHWGRLRVPERKPGQNDWKAKQYRCCGAEQGTPGCVKDKYHVFKVSEPKRLALVMQFERTPGKSAGTMANNAVCFDCEMGYTTHGMELIRLTATNWPDGKELLDILVRPKGEILNLNSRFSGVWQADFNKSVLLKADAKGKYSLPTLLSKARESNALPLAPSPEVARSLLMSLLSPNTPLIGHALENDLNTVRLIHPTIIDTVLLYPHPRGLPNRLGLKHLAKKELGIDIQMGGEQGHDSKEDANAAGDLVRLKVKRKWKELKSAGWTIGVGGMLMPPEEKIGKTVNGAGGPSGNKRKLEDEEEEEEEEDERKQKETKQEHGTES